MATVCKWHLCDKTTDGRSSNAKFCSDKCKSKWGVTVTRHRRKAECVARLGGKCVRCGYDKCPAALEFHHRDRTAKEFPITQYLNKASKDRLFAEVDKCDLVCANCHREVEDEIHSRRMAGIDRNPGLKLKGKAPPS